MIKVPYKHKMAAHCESGSITSLLNNAGLDITEPMVFGISSGIFFAYFHKMKAFPFPTFIVRNKPGQMRENLKKRTGIRFHSYSFNDPEKGKQQLNHLLERNIPAAAQVDFFYMDYIPSWERVHINVHFIVVVGVNSDHYLVSDSYFPELVELKTESMEKARFAGGNMSPKGFLFHPEFIPAEIDYEKAINKGIRKACFNMLKIPIPFVGVKGIRLFAKKIIEWPSLARDTEHLSHEIMKINVLLEDQGTGGGGFRFMFATFLQQAAAKINKPELLDFSKKMMEIGDGWREFSLLAARFGKNRDLGPERMKELSGKLLDQAEMEQKFFSQLYKTIK